LIPSKYRRVGLNIRSVAPTPAETEGETATEPELLTDSETVFDSPKTGSLAGPKFTKGRRLKPMSHHDLRNKYFRRDTILLRNLDIFRYFTAS